MPGSPWLLAALRKGYRTMVWRRECGSAEGKSMLRTASVRVNEQFRVQGPSGDPQAFAVLCSGFKGKYQLLWKSEVAVRGDRQDGVLDRGEMEIVKVPKRSQRSH